MQSNAHIPVLLPSVLTLLRPKDGETVLEVTLGLGGHAREFLRAIGPKGRYIGLDADRRNIEAACSRLLAWQGIATFLHGNFRDLRNFALPQVDILFADLGLSSPHIDDPSRGFTFRDAAPLDLRFDQSRGETAASLLSTASEEDIARALFTYGELRQSRRLAEYLHEQAVGGALGTTADVRSCVERIFGWRAQKVMARVFQALRIWVNDELGALRALLEVGPELLRSEGRFGIISYHSLEDRLVKRAFRELCTPERSAETGGVLREAPFALLTKRLVVPGVNERAMNPRSRSARLRVISRVG